MKAKNEQIIIMKNVPKNCEDCPCFQYDYEWGCISCGAGTFRDVDIRSSKAPVCGRHKDCPIQSLDDYNKKTKGEKK